MLEAANVVFPLSLDYFLHIAVITSYFTQKSVRIAVSIDISEKNRKRLKRLTCQKHFL